LPTLKMLKSRQRYVKFMIKTIFQFVIDQAVIAGALDDSEDLSFTVIPSPLAEKDTRGAALTLDKFTTSLTVAVEKGWVSNEDAAKAYKTFILQLGIELTTGEAIQKVEEEPKPEEEIIPEGGEQ